MHQHGGCEWWLAIAIQRDCGDDCGERVIAIYKALSRGSLTTQEIGRGSVKYAELASEVESRLLRFKFQFDALGVSLSQANSAVKSEK